MKTLLLVHKTHLDVGFTDLAGKVTRQYLDHFIPAALERAREMNTDPDHPRFIWTTGAWIIWKALETYEEERRGVLVEAIRRGWIAWHALPFTFHTELLSPNLLRLALKFSRDLDKAFGRKTLSAKMTDVPGHTMGLVPVLAEAGIRFLHLGVNPASRVPEVPECFRWICGEHDLVVSYARTYGSVSHVPGCDTALAFLHTNDNLGPPGSGSIAREEAYLQARYNPAVLRSGTMDDFARAVLPHAADLPVVETEIGDTWIHGAASDPAKLAGYAAIRRIVEERAPEFLDRPLNDIAAWLEPLLLLPEHTWGLDVKAWFGDHRHYRPPELAEIRRSHRFRTLEHAWREQRDYLEKTLGSFPGGQRSGAASEAEAMGTHCPPTPGRPDTAGDARPLDVSAGLTAGRWAIRFEPASGCLSSLFDTETGHDLCPASGRLEWGTVLYELYGEMDYRKFLSEYMGSPPYPWWAYEDFTKIGLPEQLAHHRSATVRFGGGRVLESADATEVVTEVQFLGDALVLEGAPADMAVSWKFYHRKALIDIRLGWNRKAATRLPEACWFGFRLPESVAAVHYHKLGQWIDPSSVVAGGGRALHAIEDRIHYTLHDRSTLAFHSPDALLAAPDAPRLLSVPETAPSGRRAVWFNLFNNIWNTNFPLWLEGAMGYRFSALLASPETAG